MGLLWWLTGFGTILLLIPNLLGIENMIIPQSGYFYIIYLSIIPTIGGFYFTIKALKLLEANKVQIIEMTGPLFTLLFVFLIWQEVIDIYELIGGIFILVGIILL